MPYKGKVLLIKQEADQDQYRCEIESCGYKCIFYPVLFTTPLENSSKLVMNNLLLSHLNSDCPENTVGIVFTSKRATAIFNKVMLKNKDIDESFMLHDIEFFVVGQATQRVLSEISHLFGNNILISGSSSGSARKLVKHIKSIKTKFYDLYFFCGKKRRQDIRNGFISSEEVKLHEIPIYKTNTKEFNDIDLLLSVDVVVFFSPSGVKCVLNKNLDSLSHQVLRTVALGPSTYEAIQTINKTSIPSLTCIEACNPTIQSVIKAINHYFTGLLYPVSCHCQRVYSTVKITKEQLNLWICNCSDCNKRKNYHIVVPLSYFYQSKYTQKHIQEYLWGQKIAKRYFCKHCGIMPYYRPRSNPDGIAVTEACIDWNQILLKERAFGKPKIVKQYFNGVNWEAFIDQSGIKKDSREN